LHGLAYYIFLKSLRSLEEFRKNPPVKIPPKSPSTYFQSLGKFKNPIFNSEILFFLDFGPADPAARLALGPASPPAAPSPQAKISRPAQPAHASVACSQEIRFPLRFTPSQAKRLPLISLTTGPRLSALSPTSSCRAHPHHHRFPVTERRSAPRLRCPRTITTSPSFPLP
jgi:hypothetical protein